MQEPVTHRILTAVGPDRPGLVERISTLIHRSGANLEDSRMAILGGEFALILLFSGTEAAAEAVTRDAEPLGEELGLTLSFRQTSRSTDARQFLPYILRISGVDRPGIVSTISSLLAARSVNFAALDSKLSYAPLSGTALFQLQSRLQVPAQLGLPGLRSDIARLCEDENLDFQLEAESTP